MFFDIKVIFHLLFSSRFSEGYNRDIFFLFSPLALGLVKTALFNSPIISLLISFYHMELKKEIGCS